MLVFNSALVTDDGAYTCLVLNGEGNAVTDTAYIRIASEIPIVTSHPSDLDVCEGSGGLFSVVANPDYLSYQWKFEGDDIATGLGANYFVNNVSASNEGNYTCVVTNACGSVYSNSALLTNVLSPEIITNPTSINPCFNDTVYFVTEAAGVNLEFQWYKNGNLITGAIDDTLQLNSVSDTSQGYYQCKVMNTCDTVISSSVVLNLYYLPSITASPISNTKCDGEPISFYATATSLSPMTSQWYFNNTIITDSTSGSISYLSLNETNEGSYICKFTNMCGSVNTDIAELIINQVPEITIQPVDTTNCIGDTTVFIIKTIGTGNISYQWLQMGADVTGENLSSYFINGVEENHASDYSCYIWNECGSVISDTVTLTVNKPPTVLYNTDTTIQCENTDVRLFAPVEGAAPMNYQWIHSGVDTTESTSNLNYIFDFQESDTGIYYCIVSNMCGIDTTDNMYVGIQLLPYFTQNIDTIETCVGDSANFTVNGEGYPEITYYWKKDGQYFGSETDSTLEIEDLVAGDAGSFSCEISNQCGTLESNIVPLIINTPPVVLTDIDDFSKCEGESVIYSISVEETSMTYQWIKNNDTIVGATNDSLSLTYLTASDSGSYICYVSNNCGLDSSSISVLTIKPSPVVDLGEDLSACEGDTVRISGGTFTIYEWNNGISHSSYLSIDSSGTFILKGTNQYSCSDIDTINVTIDQLIDANLGNDVTSCGSYTLEPTSGGTTYVWNDSSSFAQNLTADTSGVYYLSIYTAQGCESRDSIELTINAEAYVDLGDDITMTPSESITLEAPEGYETYYWSTGSTGRIITVDGDLGEGLFSFWVQVGTEAGCYDYDTISVQIQVGIEEFALANKISIYPNPNAGNFTLELSDINDEVNIEIFSLNGQKVYSTELETFGITKENINLTEMPKGIYFLKIINNNAVDTRKIIIQ